MAIEVRQSGQGSEYDLVQKRKDASMTFFAGMSSNPEGFIEQEDLRPNPGRFCHGGLVTTFNGKTRSYTIKTIKSGAEHGFVERIDAEHLQPIKEFANLVGTIQNLYCGVYPGRAERNFEVTIKRVLQSLSHPRTILEVAFYEGVPIGFGIFPRLDADGELVVYSSRAILPEHVQEGIGTYVLEQAILRHKNEAARWGRSVDELFLMTQRWESVRSLKRLQTKGVIEKIQPIDEPYNPRGLKLLYSIHSQVRLNSTGIDRTGRSEGELSEIGFNENFTPPKKGTEAAEYFEKITSSQPIGAGVNLFNGDELYIRCILAKQRPPSI